VLAGYVELLAGEGATMDEARVMRREHIARVRDRRAASQQMRTQARGNGRGPAVAEPGPDVVAVSLEQPRSTAPAPQEAAGAVLPVRARQRRDRTAINGGTDNANTTTEIAPSVDETLATEAPQAEDAARDAVKIIPVEQVLASVEVTSVELACDSGLWVFSGRISREGFRHERFFIERIAEGSTVGVPWPYHIDDSEEIFDWPYAVMRHVGGEVVTWDQDRDWKAIASAPGRGAAGLQAVTFPAPAEWQDGNLVAFGGSQRERFEGLIAELFRKAAQRGLLDDESERWVREAVAVAEVEGYVPTIVHHDLMRGNAHFTFEGDRTEVSGIFDLKECFVADPDEDLARSLWEFCVEVGTSASRAFLDAYRAERPARPGEAARLRAYVIYDLFLIGVEAPSRNHAETPKSGFGGHKTFRGWASGLVEPVERALVGF
jgi:aminoglycoside phosphotransferase (APT) family kinase protein